jgi:hypothetical protein
MSRSLTLRGLAAELDRLWAGFAAVERGEFTDYDATSFKALARRLESRTSRHLAAERVRAVR